MITADTSKIKTFVNWEPVVPFERGVEEMLKQIEYWSDAPVWTPVKIEKATEDWFYYLSE